MVALNRQKLKVVEVIQRSQTWRVIQLIKRACGFKVASKFGVAPHLENLKNGVGMPFLDSQGKAPDLLRLTKDDIARLALGPRKITSVAERKKRRRDAQEAWEIILTLQNATKKNLFTLKRVVYENGACGQSIFSLCTRKACLAS